MLNSLSLTPPTPTRRGITESHRQLEADAVASLLAITQPDTFACQMAEVRALAFITAMGQGGRGVSMASLLEQFPLSSSEGFQLMGLAEALLRIPNALTADQLIADKLGAIEWRAEHSRQQPLWLNGVRHSLVLGSHIARYAVFNQSQKAYQQLPRALLRGVLRGIAKHSIAWLGKRFVFANCIETALSRANKLSTLGYTLSYDMLGEGARCERDAEDYLLRYRQMIVAQADVGAQHTSPADPAYTALRANVSVKLSALHPRYEASQRQRVMAELVPRVLSLALLARSQGVSLTIDAEESWRLDLSLDVFATVYRNSALAGWQGFGLAVQAYQKRALAVLEWLHKLALIEGRQIPLRLVKGAYWDSEIKATQQGGYDDYSVFTRKATTDLNYQACTRFLLRHRRYFYPQFASHNPYTVAMVQALDQQLMGGDQDQPREDVQPRAYEFQRLHGMGEALFEQLLHRGESCRVYAPVGKQPDLLSYLVRRILENGANSSIVKQLQQADPDTATLVRAPRTSVLASLQASHPHIPRPRDLLNRGGRSSARINSRGCDLDDEVTLQVLQEGMAKYEPVAIQSHKPGIDCKSVRSIEIRNPARFDVLLARYELDSAQQLQDKLQRAELAFPAWASIGSGRRAHYLRELADRLELHREQLLTLCIRESGKTLSDGISEVREAVDFCRYYADQAETLFASPRIAPRGVVLCISPWNFPLAIFLGQIAAALVCGNTVVAKPARQSLLMAHCVLDLMEASGFPSDCCQLLLAPGVAVGEQVLPDSRIQAVLFTGSFATGQWLNKALSRRTPCPLIAETGGQNAMLVDASALLEQVVDAIISSAFHSAGQRCSALRVLFVQEDIAEALIRMLSGAMEQLSIGDPAQISSDLGPLIDEQARQQCREHRLFLQRQPERARLIYACALNKGCEQGYFFPPHLYEIDSLDLLKEEVFGPIVHLIRFAARDIDDVMAQVNSSGYGLTLGIQSRIASTCNELAQSAKVGNVYINRNMTGAVVGLQPFGGRGLSGTGPKAGGPLYLQRLVHWVEADEGERINVFQRFNTAGKEVRGEAVKRSSTSVYNLFERSSDALLSKTSLAQEAWARLGAAGRIRCLDALRGPNRLLATYPELQAALKQTLNTLLEVARNLLLNEQVFVGPSGESNRYKLESRGLVLIVVDETATLQRFFRQLLALLLAGNSPLIVCAWDSGFAAYWQALQRDLARVGLAPELCALIAFDDLFALLEEPSIAAVCLTPGSPLREQLAPRLANRPGAICPLISELAPEVLITALSYEKTISTNTAAAGGDVALLSLAE